MNYKQELKPDFMYKIIGGDGNEYGPVSAETLRQWIAEGRVNGETRTRSETGEWKTLAGFPEFAVAVGAQPAPRLESPIAAATPPPFSAGGQTSAVYEGDYQLDMGGCIARGWELVKTNFWPAVGTTLLIMIVSGVVNQLFGLITRPIMQAMIINHVFSLSGIGVVLAVSLISGTLGGVFYAGLFKYYLKLIRGEAAGVGDAFAGFGKSFGQLILGPLVVSVLVFLCMLPVFLFALLTIIPTLQNHGQVQPVLKGIMFVVLLLTVLPMVYLQISWLFTIPLIVDRELDFWTAMKTSWRRVNAHWWTVFGLSILAGLVSVLGLLLCCVGMLVTMPIGLAALMYAYETIFSGKDVSAP